MSETLRERHVFRDPQTELNPDKRAILERRIANNAVQLVTQFISAYAPLPPTVNNPQAREFTHMPIERDEVTEMANRFNLVADFAVNNSGYFKRVVPKPTFERLHADIEATAQRIDPLRSIHFIT